jgi:hypothetical protein
MLPQPLRYCLLLSAITVASIHAEPAPDFQREIRPILSNKCFHCHGPDQDERKGGKEGSGGLRLDTEEGSRAALDEGFSIVPGAPEKSAVIERITTDDRDDVMPPRKMGKPLTAREVGLLKRWIASGAKYANHWSYDRPIRPKVPEISDIGFQLPVTWTNPIDAFLLQRLEKEHLLPSPEADRHTLIRRVTLDLTGLPPTLEEVDTFLADTAPGAYERLVDRLLASPSYGEHWARMWLDLARYADSAGYADDPPRTIWAYRDYVINAFNRNLPFDQFTIEQIAGDLLPGATEEQLIATAFHRNTMTNNEGGTQDEEFRNAAIVDRANTTMAVWMGTSFACAQCHTHKYDPITQAEYYKVFAFLNNTADADKKDESPLLSFFTNEQNQQRAKWEKELAALDGKFKTAVTTQAAAAAKWARAFPAQLDWRAPESPAWKAESGATFEPQADGAVLVPKGGAKKDTYTLEVPVAAAQKLNALRLETLPHDSLPAKGAGHAAGNFVVTRVRAAVAPPEGFAGPVARFVRIELPGKSRILQLAEVQVFSGGVNVALQGAAKQTDGFGGAIAGRAIDGNTAGEWERASVAHTTERDNPYWEVDLKQDTAIERIAVWNRAELGERLAGFRLVALDAKRQPVWEQTGDPAPKPSASFAVNGSREIAFADVSADFTQPNFDPKLVLTDAPPKDEKKGPRRGWAVGGQPARPHTLTLLVSKPVELPAGGKLVVTIEQQSKYDAHALGSFRVVTTDDARVTEHLRTPGDVLAALATPEVERTDAQRARIADRYVRTIAPELKAERQQLATLRKQIDGLTANTVPILRELPAEQRRKTNVHIRGNYLSLGGEVTEGVPAVFHPLPPDAPNDRLALARWLVDENNPLTARVIVNRFWEQLFGIGIVRTSEEFGAQGELPEHPELLDWLACVLQSPKAQTTNTQHSTINNQLGLGWDMKAFVKLLVTTNAYRQSSKTTPEVLERDPDNRLLARGPRLRLSAEAVRDQALAVSGLLSKKMLGPSVRPPRPELGLKAAFGRMMDWETSPGEDRYRRALYTEARRTSPYPSMSTFDAPSREVCTLRRDRTNTPLQALVTLNDPVYVEAAQALARRMNAASTGVKEKARFGFRLCLSRPPSDAELDRLVRMHAEALTLYQADTKAANDMATNPLGPVPAGADIAELAAWTTVANVLLNLDEILMKR